MIPLRHDGPLDRLEWDGQAPVIWRRADPGRGSARRWSKRCFLGWQADRSAWRGVRLASRRSRPRKAGISALPDGEACLIAAARQPIAVDREIIDSAPPLWDMLTPAEACALRDATDPSRQWLRRWTIKEAYAKLIGDPGISPPRRSRRG
ncbi:hypothetical protein GCM10020258_30790 [Sphingomonas yabuuchiae]